MTIEERDAQVLRKMWKRNILSWQGYQHVQRLVQAGEDARAYWSGGESLGKPCVWAYDKRYTAEEWNTLSALRA